MTPFGVQVYYSYTTHKMIEINYINEIIQFLYDDMDVNSFANWLIN